MRVIGTLPPGDLSRKQNSARNNSIPATKLSNRVSSTPARLSNVSSLQENSSQNIIGKGIENLSEYISKPLTDKVYSEIDKITAEIRTKLAKEQKIQPQSVKNLDVAEYLLAMPTAGLNKPIEDASAAVRNAILIGFTGVCLVLYLTRSKDQLQR